MAIFFDIETGGLSGLSSSIYSLSYQKNQQKRKDIFADPVIGSRMYRWSEQNVWAEVKQQTNRVAEKELLSNWIKVLKDNTGEELIGWNIGFDVQKQIPFREQGTAFDIPMTLSRAAQHGLEEEMAEAYRGMKIRDIGREYAVNIARQVTANLPYLEGKVDPSILEQAFKFNQASERAAEMLGPEATTTDIARQLSQRRFSLAGWKQEQISDLLNLPKFAAHTAEDVTALTRFPSPDDLKLTPAQLEDWGKGALRSSLVGQATTQRFETPSKINWERMEDGSFKRTLSTFEKPTDYWDYLTSRAKAGGIDDFEDIVRSKVSDAGGSMDDVRRGLGISQGFRTVGEGVIGKIPSRLAAFDVSRVPLGRIGIGLGIAVGINSLFSGFDDEYNTIEGLRHEGMAGQLRKLNTDFGSGWQGLPSSLYGQEIDPMILSFRGSVWEDQEAKSSFLAELELRQQEHNQDIGSFKSSEMFDVNTSVYQAISRRNKDMKLVRLAQFEVNVEDADTLILKHKGISGWFKNDIQVRLAGIDAPEVAGHEGDPLDFIRMWQEQPGGQEATEVLRSIMENNENATLLVDSKRKTYGRYLGAVIGDEGQNLNLELVRSGAVTALPFGPSEFDILDRNIAGKTEKTARENREGIWQLKRFQAIGAATSSLGRPITHNTLTRLDKMGSNLTVGAYSSFLNEFGGQQGELTAQELAQARKMGRALRKTHGPYKIPKKTDSNTIEGLGHKGIAWQIRQSMTEFGSGWIRKALSIGVGPDKITRSIKQLTGMTMPVRPLQAALDSGAPLTGRGEPGANNILRSFLEDVRDKVGVNVQGQYWAKGEKLGEGGLGEVTKVFGPQGKVGALKQAKDTVATTINRFYKEGIPEGAVPVMKGFQASQLLDNPHVLEFADTYSTQITRTMKNEGFDTALQYEGHLQKLARKQHGNMVPKVYASDKNSLVQEFAGNQSGRTATLLKAGEAKTRSTLGQGIQHLDPGYDQVLRKGANAVVADWGLSAITTKSIRHSGKQMSARQMMDTAFSKDRFRRHSSPVDLTRKPVKVRPIPDPKTRLQRTGQDIRRKAKWFKAHAVGVMQASKNSLRPGRRHLQQAGKGIK